MPHHLSVYWPPPVPYSFRAASGPVTSLLPLVGLTPILRSCPSAEGTFAGAFTFTAGAGFCPPPPPQPLTPPPVALARTQAKKASNRAGSQNPPPPPDSLGGHTG